ncbi:hypothetical protein Tco_0298248, partial [Tanacetum coccineum]
ILINKAKYAQEILKKYGMTSCDSIGTPMATKKLDTDLSGTPVDQMKYRSMVGALTIQAQEAVEIERKAELQRLDALAAKRLNNEFEMSKQQRKRAAEVQQQAQYYIKEDWDLTRARMEASTELRKSVFGTDIHAEDYAKKMV